jgi:ADP-L-glycero-D-manno-heptose 6-epimerase
MENNYRFTRILAEWAARKNIRFIYASSAATYGDGANGFSDQTDLNRLRPLNPYGYSKHLFDLYALRSGLNRQIVGLKFFNVFGPNEYHKSEMASVVFKAFQQIRETGRASLFKSCRDDYGHGEQKRDFVYVKDCVEVIWQLMNRGQVNGLFNLGTGEARSFNDLMRAIFSALDLPPNIHYVEMPEILHGSYQYYTRADMRRLGAAGCELNFRSLEASVRDYVVNHLMSAQPCLSSVSTGSGAK